jgi:hypothetical protein
MRRFRVVLPAAMLLCLAAAGQSPQETVPYTLHVYTDLVQIPTLVLSPSRQTLPLIDAGKFRISLDSGPVFQPSHVRLEGDDPITLAVVLDLSINKHLPKSLGEDLASLVPDYLHPGDHISISAVDCGVIRTSHDAPADATEIKNDIDSVLKASANDEKNHATCGNTPPLRDALSVVVNRLSRLPGRRVILAFTSGHDKGSKMTWTQLKTLTSNGSVAIFGMSLPAYSDSAVNPFDGRESPFNLVCQTSGGVILNTDESRLPYTLRRFVKLIRERYILEFPRPSNATIGTHDIQVTLDKTNAFIRPAGISIPLPDPAILTDPTTVPSDPSRAPRMGNHRVPTPQQ